MKSTRTTREQRIEWLKACTLFSGMSGADVGAAAETVSSRSYSGGEILFHWKAPAEGFHVIVEGEVKVCRYGAEGREQVLHVLGAGEPCGEVPVFEGTTYPATAEAVRNTQTLYLSRDAFLVLGRERPELLLGMLAILSRRLRQFVNLIDDLSLKEVSTRLAAHFLALSRKTGGVQTVQLDTTKAMLASRLGTIAETLSRTLARMQKTGIISVQGRTISILDQEALERLAHGQKL